MMMLPTANSAIKHRSRSKDPPETRLLYEPDFGKEADSKLKRRGRRASHFADVLWSDHARRLLWCAALSVIFYLERKRNIRRSQIKVETTKVLTGLDVAFSKDPEEPADLLVSTEFVNITTGTHTFRHTESCHEYRHTENRCHLHHPFVDLDAFLTENQLQPRLKEILELPEQTDYAVLTRRGFGVNHEQGNQDRAFIIAPYFPFSPSALASPHDFLLCLMDGHGGDGHYMSHHVATEIPGVLAQALKRFATNEPDQSLHKVMFDVMRDTFHQLDQTVPYSPLSGTTLTLSIRLGGDLHVANVGDSRTMVVAYNKVDRSCKIVYLTKPHNPGDKSEKDRILKAGGSIYMPPKVSRGQNSAAVRVYSEYIDGETNQTHKYTLAVSRSIGDHLVKNIGVVADPTVATIRLAPHWQDPKVELFVAAGSDGLFDKLQTMTVADRVAASLYRTDTSTPLETIEGMLLDASDNWVQTRILRNNRLMKYRDDITIAVARIVREIY